MKEPAEDVERGCFISLKEHFFGQLSIFLGRLPCLITKGFTQTVHSCTNCANLEMEPKYLTKSDIQLKPNILRAKNDKRVL